MVMARFVAWMFSVSTIVFYFGISFAQNYPVKPIRIVMGQAGSGIDMVARVIAQGISAPLGQPVIVDNRAGTVAVEAVAKAPPDGYTLLFFGPTAWLAPFLLDTVPYDPVKDLSPITLAVTSPNTLVVHPSMPVKSVKELIALAKARPGELNYASGAAGSSNHLAAELFKAMAGVNIVRVAYKGVPLALNAVIGGQVEMSFPDAGTGSPHVKSGRIRALAVTSAKPSALAPGLPTLAGSGLPGYEAQLILGMFAPAGTPAALINRLNQEIVRVLNSADVKERLFNAGMETVGRPPEQFAATIKTEMAKWGKLIKDAGIRRK